MKHLLDTYVGPYQAMVPMVDVDTIGAGGGSIAYVDSGGIFSPDLSLYPYRAVLRHTFFLGVMLRLEFELESGLKLRSRMTKEEYAQLGLEEGREVSLQIRNYRVLKKEEGALPAEREISYQPPPTIAEHI